MISVSPGSCYFRKNWGLGSRSFFIVKTEEFSVSRIKWDPFFLLSLHIAVANIWVHIEDNLNCKYKKCLSCYRNMSWSWRQEHCQASRRNKNLGMECWEGIRPFSLLDSLLVLLLLFTAFLWYLLPLFSFEVQLSLLLCPQGEGSPPHHCSDHTSLASRRLISFQETEFDKHNLDPLICHYSQLWQESSEFWNQRLPGPRQEAVKRKIMNKAKILKKDFSYCLHCCIGLFCLEKMGKAEQKEKRAKYIFFP